MGLSCGQKFMQICLVVVNTIFLLFGLALVAVGIYALVYYSPNFWPAIVIVTLGAITVITSFFGCFGAWTENKCMLGTFAGIILFIFAGTIALGVILLVDETMLVEVIRSVTELEQERGEEYGLLVTFHYRYNCCGVDPVENGCETLSAPPPKAVCTEYPDLCKKGCLDAVKDEIVEYSLATAIVLFIMAGLLCFGILFAICVCAGSRNR